MAGVKARHEVGAGTALGRSAWACRRSHRSTLAGPTYFAPSTSNSPQASAPANYTVEQCLKDWLETLNTQAESTLTGYRIMVRHLAGLIGNVKLVELKVRDADFALGKRLSACRPGALGWPG